MPNGWRAGVDIEARVAISSVLLGTDRVESRSKVGQDSGMPSFLRLVRDLFTTVDIDIVSSSETRSESPNRARFCWKSESGQLCLVPVRICMQTLPACYERDRGDASRRQRWKVYGKLTVVLWPSWRSKGTTVWTRGLCANAKP